MWHYPYPLDEAAMMAAAKVVVGEHDFTSFAAVDPERVERMAVDSDANGRAKTTIGVAPTNVRKIFSSAWHRDPDELIYTVCGNGFLHHMVRNLVGTFILIGKGTITRAGLRAHPGRPQSFRRWRRPPQPAVCSWSTLSINSRQPPPSGRRRPAAVSATTP